MDDSQQRLVSTFANHFLTGRGFKTIVEARAEATAILGEPVRPETPQAKLVDESVELGLVQAAGVIVQSSTSPQAVYERLVDLYHRQPTLGTRSSTSIAQQAYSTPVPIAYIASQLAGIDENTIVYEPTAGNGSLLIATELSKALANELDPQRASNLRVQGYSVTQHDATTYLPDQQVDTVIANPPFGSVQEDGRAKVFEIPDAGGGQERSFTTTQIDQAIALNALRAMRDDGRAALILGGKMGDERSRSNGYNSQISRSFYYTLYQSYNVTRHISIDGDLYSRQGAGFPIDLIVIEGRGKSRLRLPAADVPQIYHSFNELQELLSYAPIHQQQQSLDVNFERRDGRHNDGGISTTRQERDIELQRIPGTISAAGEVDDPATGEPATDSEANRAIRQFWGDVLPSSSSTEGKRTPSVGDRLDRGEPIFSGETELRLGNQFSSTSERESSSTGRDRADESRRMVAVDGARTEGGLNTSVLKTTQQEIETMAEVTPEEIVEQPRQVPYEPLSRGSKGNTLVPINIHSGTANALKQLEQQVGSLDEYVADRLNYGSPERLHHYFNAEQVDAISLAISNLEKRRGFIIGDQTGVGKGRVVASTIRYAKETARIPIFVTKDPVLYADMMRDLADIGMPEFRPFITNSNLNIPLSEGRRLRTTSTTHQQEMQALAASGGIGSYDAVFTTYSQLQSVKGEETQRRNFLRVIAPNSIVILDESHEAGGSKHKDKATEADEERVPDRAEFTRELLSLSQGGVYSSATFAKRPDVMDLYFLTDMGQAVSTEKLVSLVERGGIPMQQGLATMLVEAGQYIHPPRAFLRRSQF